MIKEIKTTSKNKEAESKETVTATRSFQVVVDGEKVSYYQGEKYKVLESLIKQFPRSFK